MILLDAAELDRGLADAGRIALYGIYFDFDRATIRPESEPQLSEMAKLLREPPNLGVYIVGHTDNRGGLDYNMDLSKRRANDVVRALATDFRIARDKLTSMGVASLSPVSSHTTEEGRAKNRRVEMVAKKR